MNIGDYIKIGDMMEVEVDEQYASTKVEDIQGNTLVVDYLTAKGRPVHLRENENYSMLRKTMGGLLFFSARYEGRFKSPENRYYMRFSALSEPIKSQRRMSFRVPVLLPVKVLVVSRVVDAKIIGETRSRGPRKVDLAKDWTMTLAKDISEEGMLISMPNLTPEINSHIMVRFELNGKQVFANAVVRRHAYEKTTDTRPNMIGVQFLELDETEMRRMRKFVIDYQIEERLKTTDQLI